MVDPMLGASTSRRGHIEKDTMAAKMYYDQDADLALIRAHSKNAGRSFGAGPLLRGAGKSVSPLMHIPGINDAGKSHRRGRSIPLAATEARLRGTIAPERGQPGR